MKKLLSYSVLFGVLFLVYRNCSLIRYRRLKAHAAPVSALEFHAISRRKRRFWRRSRDYGGINYKKAAIRKISRDDVFDYEAYRHSLTSPDTKWYETPDPDCQEPSWKSRQYPTCNMMHAGDFMTDINSRQTGYVFYCGMLCDHVAVQRHHSRTLLMPNRSKGFSRVAWAVHDYTMDTSVLKMLKLKHNVTVDTLNEVHLDAVIMEELSTSPRIMEMYSYCGTSIIVKSMPYSVLDEITPPKSKLWNLLPSRRVAPRNGLSPSTKLRYALEMAESIADLHGNDRGAIIHGDIHLGQWLRKSPDDPLVLSDFNLAKVLSWNAQKGEFCKAQSGRGNGNVSVLLMLLL